LTTPFTEVPSCVPGARRLRPALAKITRNHREHVRLRRPPVDAQQVAATRDPAPGIGGAKQPLQAPGVVISHHALLAAVQADVDVVALDDGDGDGLASAGTVHLDEVGVVAGALTTAVVRAQ
jgi:hypothetical protein